ncbi:MAG: DUF6364 family protein [Chthoniobacteraceae bacterium]|jgi:hypothetical protein
METKLTLRLDQALIESAKKEARNRGASLSQMVADYFRGIQSRNSSSNGSGRTLPPVTASLLGSLRGRNLDRSQYRRHLEKKYR